jgi:energy-coupling factor transporter ATP-binding protein EcfA2
MPELRAHRLSKPFSGLRVVHDVDFTIRPGEVVGYLGPNGSGKSNMMDAISFVLGVQSRHLRSTHLKELIFRKDAHSAPARKASVKLVYVVSKGEFRDKAEGTEVHFSRSISATGVSTYKLDNRDVTYEVYEETLQTVGVLVKARNFLVFQGDVESVASKSPAELTKLLEQISGSDALKAEYEELSVKNEEAIETTTFSLQKKKMYATQKKEVKEQTRVCFTELCATITNVDIIPIIPAVIAGYMDPVKLTEKALDALISTTFINDVDVPTLGLLVPILTKGMREKKVVIKRRAALVIGNMCKLVNDPRTALLFYPILKPVLERGIDEIAVAEV